MKFQQVAVVLFGSLFLHACVTDTSQRVQVMEERLGGVEEKVDALLTYTNKTYDVVSDIDLRLETLEQDAKKRGVPVRIKGADIAAARAELARTVQPSSVQNPYASQNPQLDQALGMNTSTALPVNPAPVVSPPLVSPVQNTAPLEEPVADNKRLGGGHVMAEGLTISTGDSSPSSSLQFPSHTETTPIMPPVNPAENANTQASVDAGQPLSTQLLQQNTVPVPIPVPAPVVTPQKNQAVGAITGQNLQNQAALGTSPHPLPVPVVPPTPVISPVPVVSPVVPVPVVSSAPIVSPVVSPAPVVSSTPQNYDTAMNLYRNKQYAQAEQAFDAFLAANADGVLAPNALYWKGETFYARGLYPQAIFAFKEVQTRYPKHSKAPDSLLKTAMSYAKLGDTENANLHYLVLEEDFPQSPAAKRIPR